MLVIGVPLPHDFEMRAGATRKWSRKGSALPTAFEQDVGAVLLSRSLLARGSIGRGVGMVQIQHLGIG